MSAPIPGDPRKREQVRAAVRDLILTHEAMIPGDTIEGLVEKIDALYDEQIKDAIGVGAAIATGIRESGFTDGGSVGLFQQRSDVYKHPDGPCIPALSYHVIPHTQGCPLQ